MTAFSPRLRAASMVNRWSIVWRQRNDNIAEHSWYNAMYSMIVARLIGWDGEFADLLAMALLHDIDELVTGDIVSPVKRSVVDKNAMSALLDDKMAETVPYAWDLLKAIEQRNSRSAEIKAIVKVADELDSLFTVIMADVSGNRIMGARFKSCVDRLVTAWKTLPCVGTVKVDVWTKHIVPAIKLHQDPNQHDIGGYDIDTRRGDDTCIPVEAEAPKTRGQALGRASRGNPPKQRKAKVGTLPRAGAGKNKSDACRVR